MGLLLVLLVALMTCVFSTLDNAVTLVHSSGETDIGQWPRALLALSGLAAGFVFDWKRVHGADHVLRDDALHHRPVTAAGWPFGWGCCWQALWERRRSRCTNSGKAAAMIPPLRSEEPFL